MLSLSCTTWSRKSVAMVLDTVKLKNRKSTIKAQNAWKRCCKRVDSQGEHFTCTQNRFLSDQVCRESQLLTSWTEQKCIKHKRIGKTKSHVPSLYRGIQKIPRTMVSLFEDVRQKRAYATSTRFSSSSLSQKPSSPWVWRAGCRTKFSTAIQEMALFHKRFMVGHVWLELVEFIRFFKVTSLLLQFGSFAVIAIHCNRRGV